MTAPDLRYGSSFSAAGVRLRTAFPPSRVQVGVLAARSSSFAPSVKARGERVVIGAAVGIDPEDVRRRSLAELVERVSAVRRGQEWRREQPGSTGYPAVDLVRNVDVPVPAADCLLQFDPDRAAGGGLANGTAAHPDRRSAIAHALHEAVERHHCLSSWYLPGWPVTEVVAGTDPELVRATEALGSTIRLFQVGHPPDLNTVVALVARPDGSELTTGSCTGPDLRQACDRAVGEALMLQYSIRNSGAVLDLRAADRPASPRTSVEHVLHHFDRGRTVVDRYRARVREVGERAGEKDGGQDGEQADGRAAGQDTATWSQPGRQGNLRPSLEQSVAAVRDALGVDVLVADIGDVTAKDSGWNVTRVLLPGAVAYAVGDLLPRQGVALIRAARERGLRPAAPQPEPHPFA